MERCRRAWHPLGWLLAWGLLPVAAAPAAPGPGARYLPEWLRLGAEYRVETQYVDPLDLNGTAVRHTYWTEQRLRIDAGVRLPRYGGVFVQVDLLDGVLFGDNGQFGRAPEPTSGVALTSPAPNQAGWHVGLRPGGDPLDPRDYVPVLRDVEPLRIRQAYGEVYLPIGLLRVGRQPVAYGAGIAGHEGTRTNRWGVSRYSHVADRILFGTKVDQIVKALACGPSFRPDPAPDRGVLFALAYDWATQDDVFRTGDDLHQVSFGLQWLVPRANWGGLDWRDLVVSGFAVYRHHEEFATDIWALPLRVAGSLGRFSIDLQTALFVGETREIAAGFAALTQKPVRTQNVLALGVHAQFDVRVWRFEFGLGFDYASGDDDPRPGSDLTVFSFDRDFNVGLLLFEHIVAFASARSAAVGIENLKELQAQSFPLSEVATDGRFTNAIALFPQVRADIVDHAPHRLTARFGALFAWPAASGGLVDPIRTALAEDGRRIADDAVNYADGRPGRYYGTELDLQIRWEYTAFFDWTVEAAVLFPGSSLRDANGDAVTAFHVANRFTFTF